MGDHDEGRQYFVRVEPLCNERLPTAARMTSPTAKALTIVEMFVNRMSLNLLPSGSAVYLVSKTEYCAPPADFMTNEHMNERT